MKRRLCIHVLAVLAIGLAILPAPRSASAVASPHTLAGAIDFVDGRVGWAVVSTSEAYTNKRCVVGPGGAPGCGQAAVRIDASTDAGAHWRTILQTHETTPLQDETGLPSIPVHLVTERTGYAGWVPWAG